MAYQKQGQRSKSDVSRVRWRSVWDLVYRRHWTMAEASRSLRVDHETVRYYIKKGPPPGWHPPKERPAAEVIELRPRAGRQQRNSNPAPK
jgi:hypothetical protein